MAQSAWVRKQREQERARQLAERQYRAQMRERARLQRELEREQARADKERQRIYVEGRVAEAEEQNDALHQYEQALGGLLTAALAVDPHVDFGTLKVTPTIPEFEPGDLAKPEAAARGGMELARV